MKTISPSATSKKNFASPKNLRIFAPLKNKTRHKVRCTPHAAFFMPTHIEKSSPRLGECVSSNARVVMRFRP